jgi:hypothetical protein
LHITFAQKEWWAIAAIAGLIHTGAVFNMLLRTFLYIQPSDKINGNNLSQISPFFDWVLNWADNLTKFPTTHILIYIIVSLAIFVILVLLALIAQYILLFIVSKGTGDVSWKQIRSKLHHLHILRLFSINAVMKISFTIIIGLISLILAQIAYHSDFYIREMLLRIALYTITIPILFFIQMFCMTALVQLVKKETSIGKVIVRSINLLRNHWVTAFEIALILFIINFLTSGVLFISLMCIAIIGGFIFQITLSAGSYILLSFVTFATVIICGTLMLIYAGATTTFNFSVWTQMCTHLEKYSHFAALKHMIGKIIN